MYFDTCYVTKFYLREPDSASVRQLVAAHPGIFSSALATAELHASLHRGVREGKLTPQHMAIISASFEQDVALGLWNLIPLTDVLLRATGSSLLNAPTQLFLRAGDSIHLTTARHAGEREIWTSDRHMLAAAKHFGLTGRSV